MSSGNYYLWVFESKNHAMLAFNLLESSGYADFEIVSTPCGIKSGCTYSLKFFHHEYLQLVNQTILELNLLESRIFYVDNTDSQSRYKEIIY